MPKNCTLTNTLTKLKGKKNQKKKNSECAAKSARYATLTQHRKKHQNQ